MSGKMEFRFGTVINCIDGRVQEPVVGWLREKCGLDYIDVITEPGPEQILCAGEKEAEAMLRGKVEISLQAHRSRIVALAGHYDCAGNPAPDEERKKQVIESIKRIRNWEIRADVVGLWVDEERKVKELLEK